MKVSTNGIIPFAIVALLAVIGLAACGYYDDEECELRGLQSGEYLVRNYATGKAERIRCPMTPRERTAATRAANAESARTAEQEREQEFRIKWQRTQEANRQDNLKATATATAHRTLVWPTRQQEARTEVAATQTAKATRAVATREAVAATRAFCELSDDQLQTYRNRNDEPAIRKLRITFADEIRFCGIE